MSDVHAITQTLRRLRAEQIRYLVATVMQVSGSSCRQPGARMIIGGGGSATGGISAGCLEAAIQAVLSGSAAKPLSQCLGRIYRRRIASFAISQASAE